MAPHDFQEPDLARCFNLSGPTPTRARDLRRLDTARCPGCNSTRIRIGLGNFAARLRLGHVVFAA